MKKAILIGLAMLVAGVAHADGYDDCQIANRAAIQAKSASDQALLATVGTDAVRAMLVHDMVRQPVAVQSCGEPPKGFWASFWDGAKDVGSGLVHAATVLAPVKVASLNAAAQIAAAAFNADVAKQQSADGVKINDATMAALSAGKGDTSTTITNTVGGNGVAGGGTTTAPVATPVVIPPVVSTPVIVTPVPVTPLPPEPATTCP